MEEYGEEYTSFEGCTCEHSPELHGWGKCDVNNCSCEGGWTE